MPAGRPGAKRYATIYAACAPGRPRGVSGAVFQEVERVVDPGRLLAVAQGAYRIARAYILFVENGSPSDAPLHPLFDEVFQSLKRGGTGAGSPEPRRGARLMIHRGGHGGSGRVTPEEESAFDALAVDYGFQRERLKTRSFQAQVDLFSRAEVIVGPHGSGLANLVFARKGPDVKIVELQTEIDAPGMLRPWFFVIAAAGGRAYAFLNRATGDLTADRLRQSLTAVGVKPPALWRRFARRLQWRTDRWRRHAGASIRARLTRRGEGEGEGEG